MGGAEVTETDLKREICDWLAKFPNACLFSISPPRRGGYKSKFMPAGWPDIFGVWNGKPLFIEVKKPEGAISLEQHKFIERARKLGAIAFFATSVEDVMGVLS